MSVHNKSMCQQCLLSNTKILVHQEEQVTSGTVSDLEARLQLTTMDGTVATSDTEVSGILQCPLAGMSVVLVSLSSLLQ
jgi:hypothetical protein